MRATDADVADSGLRDAELLGQLVQLLGLPQRAYFVGLFGRDPAFIAIVVANMGAVLPAIEHVFRWRFPVQVPRVDASGVAAGMRGLMGFGRRRTVGQLAHEPMGIVVLAIDLETAIAAGQRKRPDQAIVVLVTGMVT